METNEQQLNRRIQFMLLRMAAGLEINVLVDCHSCATTFQKIPIEDRPPICHECKFKYDKEA